MNRIREALRSDGGMSLVEVMVALFIFALVSTGFIYTMMSVMSISRDTKVRQVATQLAAEELDVARGVPKVIELGPTTRSVEKNGDTFVIERVVEWVADSDATTEFKCGASSSGQKLRYKRVNVRVSWSGMKSGATPVQADTVLTPNEGIVEEGRATVLFTVLKSDGTGAAGVTITSSPAIAIPVTDSQGCSAALNVPPGKYTFTIAKPKYVDEKHVETPAKKDVQISAGSTLSMPFQYDEAAEYKLTLAAGGQMPTGTMDVAFVSTMGTHVTPLLAETKKLHPHPGGYAVMVGNPSHCAFVDAREWPDTPELSVPKIELYGSNPGTKVNVPISVPTVTVEGANNSVVIAVSKNGTEADSCVTPMKFSFSAQAGQTRILSLPYGSWDLYRTNVTPGNLLKSVLIDPRVPVTP